jgi:hypothetical protein
VWAAPYALPMTKFISRSLVEVMSSAVTIRMPIMHWSGDYCWCAWQPPGGTWLTIIKRVLSASVTVRNGGGLTVRRVNRESLRLAALEGHRGWRAVNQRARWMVNRESEPKLLRRRVHGWRAVKKRARMEGHREEGPGRRAPCGVSVLPQEGGGPMTDCGRGTLPPQTFHLGTPGTNARRSPPPLTYCLPTMATPR